MTDTNRKAMKPWATEKAIVLAAVCLMAGIVAGWFVRGALGPGVNGSAKTATPSAMNSVNTASQAADPARLKQIADAQAAPLIEKLKSSPNDPELLAGIGNFYYDAQQFAIAIDYYGRSLKTKPADAAVRTDMATAYWYLGNADRAIEEYNKALNDAPDNPNTLFNRGLVKLRGKMDTTGALADFQKLLLVAPNYPGKSKVEEMMAEAKKESEAKSETKTK